MLDLQQSLKFEAQRVEKLREDAAIERFADENFRDKTSVNWGPIVFAIFVIAFFGWQIVPFVI